MHLKIENNTVNKAIYAPTFGVGFRVGVTIENSELHKLFVNNPTGIQSPTAHSSGYRTPSATPSVEAEAGGAGIETAGTESCNTSENDSKNNYFLRNASEPSQSGPQTGVDFDRAEGDRRELFEKNSNHQESKRLLVERSKSKWGNWNLGPITVDPKIEIYFDYRIPLFCPSEFKYIEIEPAKPAEPLKNVKPVPKDAEPAEPLTKPAQGAGK